MFKYKQLYQQLGNLFYAIAYADDKITQQEKECLAELVQFNWKHFESTTDEFATDAANYILFQFDFNESELRRPEHAFKAFEAFVQAYGHGFTDYLKDKIFNSARRIAESTRRMNDEEVKMLIHLREILHMEHHST